VQQIDVRDSAVRLGIQSNTPHADEHRGCNGVTYHSLMALTCSDTLKRRPRKKLWKYFYGNRCRENYGCPPKAGDSWGKEYDVACSSYLLMSSSINSADSSASGYPLILTQLGDTNRIIGLN
jgi:hypothetical protein